MNDLLREFLELPQEGWYGYGFVARQVLRLGIELAVFLAFLGMTLLLIYSLWPGDIPSVQ